MERYANYNGDSGVHSFHIEPDLIDIQFDDGAVYRYTSGSAGYNIIEEMKRLALAGRGLNSYINRYAKYDYAIRLK